MTTGKSTVAAASIHLTIEQKFTFLLKDVSKPVHTLKTFSESYHLLFTFFY